MARVPASEVTHKRLKQMIRGKGTSEPFNPDVACLIVRLTNRHPQGVDNNGVPALLTITIFETDIEQRSNSSLFSSGPVGRLASLLAPAPITITIFSLDTFLVSPVV